MPSSKRCRTRSAGKSFSSSGALSVPFAKLKEAELVAVERQGTSLISHLNMSILKEALSGLMSFREPKP